MKLLRRIAFTGIAAVLLTAPGLAVHGAQSKAAEAEKKAARRAARKARRMEAIEKLKEKVKEIRYVSSADQTEQPALWYAPKTEKAVPLLVGLHTWSGGYTQGWGGAYAKWCIKNGWVLIYPNFRGPNKKPAATGSELVVQDIISAVEYAKKNANVDEKRIYLAGASGGGYTSLLIAGRAPQIWAGVSAWVPISDLKAWHAECKAAGRGYYRHVEKSCGGPPGASPEVDLEYKNRSPVTWLHHAREVPLDINAGIHDGHKGSVPISHSLIAFNVVAAEKDRVSDEDIKYFVEKEAVPPRLKKPISDRTYGRNKPLFRRTSGRARVTIFEGGHTMISGAAFKWLAKQRKE